MLREFREFVMRGSVVDLAIGIVIGAAFGRVVSSFVSDILLPPIGLVVGRVDFTNLFIALGEGRFRALAEAKAAGVPTINYGLFINTLLDFVIVAFAVFLVVRQVNRMRRQQPEAPPRTRECPYCLSTVPHGATRCAHCTSALQPA